MPSHQKESAGSTSPRRTYAEVMKAPPPKPVVGRVPSLARFFLVIFSSLAISSTLFTLTSSITLGELGRVSKHYEEWWEVGGLMGWKAVEVALAWVLGFDGRDVLNFSFLIHLPTYVLLSSFYGLRPTTILASYAIVLFSSTVPFVLLRDPSLVHNLSRASPEAVSNRSLLQDWGITICTALLATAIYTVNLYLHYETWLPASLVVYLERLPNIAKAHAGPAGLPILFVSLLPAGWAARDFLFASSAGTPVPKGSDVDKEGSSSRHGEYLAASIYRKTWGALSPRTRVLISRTAILAAFIMTNTIAEIAGTINGASVEGASAWGFVWTLGTVIVGLMYGWIEAVDGF